MRKRIEIFFGEFARVVFKHPLITLLIVLGSAASLFSNLADLQLDASVEAFLHEDDPALLDYNDFRNQFGRDELSLIAIGPTQVFSLDFLKTLRSMHEELEETVPYLDEVNSLFNARNTQGVGDELLVDDLLEQFPSDESELPALKALVLSNPVYQNLLISEDGLFTTVIVRQQAYSSLSADGELQDTLGDDFESFELEETPAERSETPFLTEPEKKEAVRAITAIVKKYNSPEFPLSLAGFPVVADDIRAAMRADMSKFMGLAVLTIALFLFVMFRRISGVVAPLLIVILSLLSTVSCMAMAHVPIMMPTQILPSFLLAVGVGDSVHILAIFYHRLDKGDDKESAIIYAMQHSGLAVLMTSLTTAAGLASFSTAEVAPIAHLGIFASFGVLLAFVYTVTILPSLISLLPISSKAPKVSDGKHGEASYLDRLLDQVADISTSYPKIIIGVSLMIIVGSLSLATTIRFSHDPLSWLASDSPVRKSTYLIDEQLQGSGTMEVIIDTGQENGLVNPTLLHVLDEANQLAEEIDDGSVFVGKILSITDILKEIHQALHANDPSFHLIADDRELLAQELLLFENSGSDDLEDFVDSQFQKARVTIKVPWLDAVEYTRFTEHIQNLYRDRLGELAQVHTTGMLPLLTRTVDAAMRSAVRSYIIAGIVISLMMILLVGNWRLGLLCMLPNLTPIFLMAGVMGIFDMPLDMFTMLIGSIAIGLAVDDTIHFMRNYTRYFAETGDNREAVRHTLQTTGRAMFITTVVLALGFFIYMFSSMHNLFNFGLLTGLAIVTALLADYFLAPALVTLLARSGKALSS